MPQGDGLRRKFLKETHDIVEVHFISGFPKVDGKASVMVVVDRFSKYAIFIVSPTLCSSEIATELFYKFVVKVLVFHLIL